MKATTTLKALWPIFAGISFVLGIGVLVWWSYSTFRAPEVLAHPFKGKDDVSVIFSIPKPTSVSRSDGEIRIVRLGEVFREEVKSSGGNRNFNWYIGDRWLSRGAVLNHMVERTMSDDSEWRIRAEWSDGIYKKTVPYILKLKKEDAPNLIARVRKTYGKVGVHYTRLGKVEDKAKLPSALVGARVYEDGASFFSTQRGVEGRSAQIQLNITNGIFVYAERYFSFSIDGVSDAIVLDISGNAVNGSKYRILNDNNSRQAISKDLLITDSAWKIRIKSNSISDIICTSSKVQDDVLTEIICLKGSSDLVSNGKKSVLSPGTRVVVTRNKGIVSPVKKIDGFRDSFSWTDDAVNERMYIDKSAPPKARSGASTSHVDASYVQVDKRDELEKGLFAIPYAMAVIFIFVFLGWFVFSKMIDRARNK